jgi:hypothetical protein
MGAPVIVALVAVVALLGAMVFVVATHKDKKPENMASSDLVIDLGSGTNRANVDPSVVAEQLKSFMPETTDLAGIAGIGRAGASWQQVDETAFDPAAEAVCAHDRPEAQAGFARQWALVDQDGGTHGQLLVKVVDYDSATSARAAVALRGAKKFELCHLAELKTKLEASVGDDVDPPVVTRKTVTASPTASLLRISTAESFRTVVGACTHYDDASWRQVGTRVIGTDFSVCKTPFDPNGEAQVDAAIKSQMRG